MQWKCILAKELELVVHTQISNITVEEKHKWKKNKMIQKEWATTNQQDLKKKIVFQANRNFLCFNIWEGAKRKGKSSLSNAAKNNLGIS